MTELANTDSFTDIKYKLCTWMGNLKAQYPVITNQIRWNVFTNY